MLNSDSLACDFDMEPVDVEWPLVVLAGDGGTCN